MAKTNRSSTTTPATFEESAEALMRASLRLRALLDATRIAAMHGEDEEPGIVFDGDSMRAALDLASIELDKISDAAFAMDSAHTATA